MTTEPCRDRTGDLGAEALGRLTPEQSLGLASHVDGCPGCRAELAELRAAAAALHHADPVRVSDRVDPPAALADLVTRRVAVERRLRGQRSRRRALIGVAAAAAVAAVVVAGALLAADGSDGARRTEVAFTVAPAGADSSAVLLERRWGTEVRVAVAGLAGGETYWLWLSGAGDERVGAGTFAGVPGEAEVVMASAMALVDVRRVWVTDAVGDVVLDGFVPS